MFRQLEDFQSLRIRQIFGPSRSPLVDDEVIENRNVHLNALDIHGGRSVVGFFELKTGSGCQDVNTPRRRNLTPSSDKLRNMSL